jgi:hypothetical protein
MKKYGNWFLPMTIRMVAAELGMDKESVCQILTTNMETKRVCAMMVPKNLTDDP